VIRGGVRFTALLLLGLAISAQAQLVSVKESPARVVDFGARCDGRHDDSSAFREAVKALSDRPHRLLLPEGVCRITAPIVIPTPMVQLVGEGAGSVIEADYATWSDPKDFAALELRNTDAWVTIGRAFRDFSVRGVHNGSVVSTGIRMLAVNNRTPEGHYLAGILMENIFVNGFDTGVEVRDTIRSSFRFVQVDQCRVGFALLGENVNDQFQNLFAGSFSLAHTSSRDQTIGFVIDSATYSDHRAHGPEGIILTDSAIVGADTNLLVRQGLFIVASRNVLDLAHGSSVVIEDPNTFRLEDNYLSSQGTAQSVVLVRSPQVDIDSLSIVGNQIDGLGKKDNAGLTFSSGTQRRGVLVERNHLIGLAAPVRITALPETLVLRDNYGSGNSGPFIQIDGEGKAGPGVVIEGNTSSDRQLILQTRRTGFTLGVNTSASQSTGPK